MAKKDLYAGKDADFKKSTEKTLKEWKSLVDKSGSGKKGHTAIYEFLMKEHKVDKKWANAIAIRYEKDKFLKK